MPDHDAVHPNPLAGPGLGLGRWRDRLLLAAVRTATRQIEVGRLRLTLPSGETAVIGRGAAGGPLDAALTLVRFRSFLKTVSRGSIGFADAYMAGDMRTSDLGALFRFFLANKARLEAAGRGQFKVRASDRAWHARRDNTRVGSRRNIAAHYDLGNTFYAPWLDASMTYSSALFTTAGQTLEAAQQTKLDRIVSALELRPGMRVLEIGCGWGALAERLARTGCHVTAITVSEQQLAYTRARIARAGLADQVDVKFLDYRDLAGTFDRIVSVEMIEAVGEQHWPAYFGTLAAHLAPGGHAVVQAITMQAQAFDAYRRKPDFIQRYIFPGGMLLTPAIMAQQAAHAGLGYAALETFGASYAQTLRAWRERFIAAWPDIASLGFDERFRLMWLYYLTYCEVGFEAGRTDVGLYRFAKPATA